MTSIDDSRTRVWDTRTGAFRFELDETRKVTDVAWSPDGTRVLVASADKRAWLYDAANRRPVTVLNGHTDYVTARADVSGRLPSVLAAKMPDCHFLFLGYSMQDWNLRVVLNRVWREQNGMSMNSWAVQKEHERPEQNEVEEKLWEDLGEDVRVFLFQVPLKEYVSNLWPHLFGGVLAGAGT